MHNKVLVKNSSAQKDIKFETFEIPTLKPHQSLLKVNAVGICGSDLHMYDGHGGYDWVTYPLVLGHEVTGKVVAVAEGEIPSQRMVINPYKSCGVCEFCLAGDSNRCDFDDYKYIKTPTEALRYGFREPGGMAEYMIVDNKNLIPIQDEVTDEVAAISEALAVSYTAIVKVENFAQKSILVVGPGPIGLGAAAILVGFGNPQVVMLGTTDDKDRLQLAKDIGVSAVYENVEDIPHEQFKGFDAIIDCSGHPTIPNTALRLLKRGGELILVGINPANFSVPMDQIVRGEISIKGSYGITQSNYEAVLSLAADARFPFQKLIAQTVPFNNCLEGFESALNKASGKVVIKM
ncbi:zinc-binding dehydrogenase [Psychrobacillus sp. NPDC096623]|uniref:zinc-dependent alcohol dehydrogenase n=1 Tax=Psychrobacillus sp. NPDC096623 TaxID=3364492 RepID=UPI0037FE5362